jgi:type II secretory pathway pseudopilin PulG
MTMLEVAVALAVLAVGASAAAHALLGLSELARAASERSLAQTAAQNRLEVMQGADFAEVFVRFNAVAADDPALGVSPGNAFDVLGLEPQPGDVDGLAGEIIFPGNGASLSEQAVDTELGMPRDLNGDAAMDALNHATDYRVLPLRIRVRWRGVSGDHVYELGAMLSNDKNVP